MQLRWNFLIAFASSLVVSAPAFAADRRIEFNRDVRPILSNNCFLCHGPDKNQLQAGLRLDKRDAAVSKLESEQTAIVPRTICPPAR